MVRYRTSLKRRTSGGGSGYTWAGHRIHPGRRWMQGGLENTAGDRFRVAWRATQLLADDGVLGRITRMVVSLEWSDGHGWRSTLC